MSSMRRCKINNSKVSVKLESLITDKTLDNENNKPFKIYKL